jgi:hypothetical protein
VCPDPRRDWDHS